MCQNLPICPFFLPALGHLVSRTVESQLLSPDSSQEWSGKPVRKKECVRDEGAWGGVGEE